MMRFLDGGGSMGAMLRKLGPEFPLGAPATWPVELRSLVGVMLSAPQPMFIAWGPEQRMLYNDGYAEILGNHHPALGRAFLDVWAEIAEQVGPIMDRAYAGEPTYMDDIELVLTRHGRPEEAHFSFFYTPVRGDAGKVGGVFCACTETTQQVAMELDRRAEIERLREMFEQSPSFVAVLRGPDHRYQLANQAYMQLTGQRNVIGKSVREAFPDLEGQGFFELLDKVYTTQQPFKGEAMPLKVQRSGGAPPSTRYLDFIYQPLRNSLGQVTGIFVEGIDLTAMHEQARVLRESEEKFRTFAQAVPNHVWTAPANGQLDWFNEQTLAYSGLSMAELAGSGWVSVIHPDDVDAAARRWNEALATGASYEIEFRIRRGDGVYRWHLVRAVPIRDQGGTVVRWVGTNTDIEQQRSDREALVQLNASLECRVEERTRERDRIWRNSPDLIAVLRHDGVFTEVNPAWTQILGWAPHEVAGRRIDALVHPDDQASAEIALQRATVGVLPTFECRMLHADGSHRSIAWTAAPEGAAIFAFGRDITPDKAQKQALALAEEQLRQSQKMEAIGQLTGGIAHDFNNMLASIYGSIQLMQRKIKNGKLDGLGMLLERASNSTQRASSLTQRLLAFARRQSLDIHRVNVVRLIESLEDMFARTLGPKIMMTIELTPGLWSARIDDGQLESALLNLVINARDAMPGGGRLSLTVENVEIDAANAASEAEVSAGDYVAIHVADDGVGMPPNVIARVFEPFFTTKPIGQGTGLGLSMVYGFVKQAGGHIRIHSAPGQGTTVSLFLPRDTSDDEAELPVAEPLPATHAGTGETILVVEDEVNVRAVTLTVLQELGYRCIEAADAQAALAVFDAGTPIDLLVSDVGLPGMNGRQLAEIATMRRPGLKVLFITGYAEQATVRHGFLNAGMEMITKPFVIDELAARVRAILASPAPKPQEAPLTD